MKTYPFLFRILSILSALGWLLMTGCSHGENADGKEIDRKEVIAFLGNFSYKLNQGDAVALRGMFEVKMSPKTLERLSRLLTGKKDPANTENQLINVKLDVDGNDIKTLSDDLVSAEVHAELTAPDIGKRLSSFILKIRKIRASQFKIIQIDTRKFIGDYNDYAGVIKNKISGRLDSFNPDLFNPKTIAAFKIAAQLKTKYDSVPWFAFNNNKTYYYVVKGKWNLREDLDLYQGGAAKDDYKMGLVGPGLNEIIPVGYTLIHNIGSIFPNLVEVENGDHKGFFDLNGKEIVPAKYNRIYPIDDDNNLAVLQDGLDYYFLKKDLTISAKVDLKPIDFFSKIRKINTTIDLQKEALNCITEYNEISYNWTVYLPPSYLVDLNLAKKALDFRSPTREKTDQGEEFGQKEYSITPADKIENSGNWFSASFYAIKDYFIDARYEFYDSKNLVIVDKKQNRVFTHPIAGDYILTDFEENFSAYQGPCNINSVRAINDTLFEVSAGANLRFELYDKTKAISGGPYYHYYSIKGDKLIELPNERNFGFTKYIKMDDSYLSGCYTMLVGHDENNKGLTETIDGTNAEMLRFMKNEIYADYKYRFKDKRWQDIFYKFEHKYDGGNEDPLNVNVDNSLTSIDKYNINWIVQKLKGIKVQSNVLATK